MATPRRMHTDERTERLRKQPPSVWISPWPSVMPWWVMLGGVLLGRWVGFTPHLFVAMAGLCLLLGVLKGDGFH